jgi:beta-galactosidase
MSAQQRALSRPLRALLASLLAALVLATPVEAWGRNILELNDDWRFVRGEVESAARLAFDEGAWEQVSLPHTFNASDGDDGGGYYRGPAWYRRSVTITARRDRRFFLEFAGAALVADAWVNGRHVGQHRGGYAGFRFDITDALRAGANTIAVRVDNTRATDVAPLGGDFTVFGGLYRGVRLIETPAVHVDALDYGGPGVYASFRVVPAERAEGTVRVRVRNGGLHATDAVVRVRIEDAAGRTVARGRARLADLPAGDVVEAHLAMTIPHPRLWDGRRDPYLYRIVADVTTGGARDSVQIPLGVRDLRYDAAQGFFLNGRPVRLHGANYFHSGRPGRGLAVGTREIEEDMQILSELGLNALRFVHFQHPQRAYDRADALGLLVWTEIPLNAAVDAGPAFEANVVAQMRELIRQNQHHPSVVIWGLGNEVYASNADTNRILAAAQSAARAADPTRPTAYAHCCLADDDPNARHSDAIGYNRYFGWYDGEFSDMGAWADRLRAARPDAVFAVSEYGAGASAAHQEAPPRRPEPEGRWHPEQYQTFYHEQNWPQLRARPFLWGSFVWVAFDLASDGRNEGDRPGINDKGLVTYDRAVRKDAYYFYQAQWSDSLMVHIADRRLRARAAADIEARVFSNAERITLVVNGMEIGETAPAHGVAVWPLRLRPGVNRVEARARRGETRVTDVVEWVLEQSP